MEEIVHFFVTLLTPNNTQEYPHNDFLEWDIISGITTGNDLKETTIRKYHMDKIQELTSKLYTEGVEKGREEADRIIAEAKAKAKQMLDEAESKAGAMIAAAEKELLERREHTEAELRLYAAQAVEALRSEITNLVTDKLVSLNVRAALEDTQFMQELITSMADNWSKNEPLTLGVEDAASLESYIAANVRHLLEKGVKIESVNGIGSGFILSPGDGSYKVRFGEEEFINYFREFLRPQIQKLLF